MDKRTFKRLGIDVNTEGFTGTTYMTVDEGYVIYVCRESFKGSLWVAFSDYENAITEFGFKHVRTYLGRFGKTREQAVNCWLNDIAEGLVHRAISNWYHAQRSVDTANENAEEGTRAHESFLDVSDVGTAQVAQTVTKVDLSPGAYPVVREVESQNRHAEEGTRAHESFLDVSDETIANAKPIDIGTLRAVVRAAVTVPAYVSNERLDREIIGSSSFDYAIETARELVAQIVAEERTHKVRLNYDALVEINHRVEELQRVLTGVEDIILSADELRHTAAIELQDRIAYGTGKMSGLLRAIDTHWK